VSGASGTVPDVRLAYVTAGFPDLTQSFVRREVETVRALGVPLTIFSVRPAPRRFPDPTLARYVEETIYGGRRVSFALLAAHGHFLRRAPRRYLAALGRVLALAFRQRRCGTLPLRTCVVFPMSVYFARVMEQRGVTHVHAHFANHPTTAARIAASLLGVPFTFTGHAWDIFVPANQIGLAEKIADAAAVVTCTEFNRKFLCDLVPRAQHAKIALCYHGIRVPAVTPPERAEDLIVAVGRLTAKKGFQHLITACAQLARDDIGFRCVIIGEGEERSVLEEAIAHAGLRARITLVGARSHREVMEWMARAAVFALPSMVAKDGSMDGIPNVILEAFAVETPVVSTRLSGIPEVVRDGETGVLVPPDYPVALAAALHDVLAHPEAHRARARRGCELVAAAFDLDRNVRSFLAWITASHGDACVAPSANGVRRAVS
jgi:colanic acid/amylovoran biosynthesis glycosyltransferase